ncbi:hypothetical protein BDN72DRAFT_852796 [Pluteus cervinus]|uniref:Uncharacterized protein n=1 Tax=Pluteus cervinus TaxID=181527 RepID=A0ACD3BFP8_9AGAR|nr:hypothetical protein BDN72DRAFT_852796 [Pluteus cervinus]
MPLVTKLKIPLILHLRTTSPLAHRLFRRADKSLGVALTVPTTNEIAPGNRLLAIQTPPRFHILPRPPRAAHEVKQDMRHRAQVWRKMPGRQILRVGLITEMGDDVVTTLHPSKKVPAGFGFAIWDHVANVASSLTVNVSKAWATNITSEDGEATPEGQESRLTRAMKAYHLEKARDPSDLPAWLFDERERRAKNSTRGRQEFVDDEPEPLAALPAQSSGLRAIYASAAATPVKKPRQDPTYYGEAPSRAADRLKALRDAKRGIMRAASVSDEQPVSRMPSSEPPRPARVGLPSGPMGSRRR